ncbi:hypothetical protein [Curtobacterium luteum]|uniref:hypothetical protein n=1 Tax=Curtobacterium luteum TaxID=33881 RepID=UPI00381888EE
MIDLLFCDPIPLAQRHYERQLQDVFESGGGSATLAEWSRPVEGRTGRLGKTRMLANAVHNIRAQRSETRPVLQSWPSLGLLETRLWSSPHGSRYVMLHDPAPLRPQVGHGPRARSWAAAAPSGHRPVVLVQTAEAHRAARDQLPDHRIEQVLHPILRTQRSVPKTAVPSVIVAGQWKPARDLDLLATLGPLLRDRGWETTIVGRGWPEVDGWSVEDRFVAEDELETMLGRSWVHLLPYTRYFQSGVTVRALEMGTQTVGAATDFLTGLFGSDSPAVVRDGRGAQRYLDALTAVIEGGCPDLVEVQSAFFARARASWEVVR